MKKLIHIFLVLLFVSCGSHKEEGVRRVQSAVDWKQVNQRAKYVAQNSVEDILPTLEKFPPRAASLEPEVKRYVDFFTSKVGKQDIIKGIERREKFHTELKRIFTKEGLPTSLISLALIESGFRPNVKSPMGAVGLWQFTKPTARSYGLEVNLFWDDRKDVRKSTHAAARHLRDLFNRYNDWYLALAAYNGGVGRVNSALRKGSSRNFFNLARKGYFAKETRNFVPKVVAASLIVEQIAA